MKRKFLFVILFFIASELFANDIFDTLAYWNKQGEPSYEVREIIPEHNSIINWTSGIVFTVSSVLVKESEANVGKYFDYYYSVVREALHKDLLKAIGSLRISDVFYLKDYYAMKSDLRYEIVDNVNNAVYYPTIQKGSRFYGLVELKIFGENGLANLFYRRYQKTTVTKYVNESTDDAEYYDGLIIDTKEFPEFQPSIELRIYDQDGALLYGPETVNSRVLEDKGICFYTTGLSEAFRSKRVGYRLFYTMPYAVSGNHNSSIILHNKDAKKLLANSRTLSFLTNGNLVIVK